MDPRPAEPSDVASAATIAALGLGDADEARVVEEAGGALDDPSPRVRAAAIGALARRGTPARAIDAWRRALDDGEPVVRRRAAELTPTIHERAPVTPEDLAPLLARLGDADTTVVEAAAYALGELEGDAIAAGAVEALARTVTEHDDAVAREAAVAALGALGDPAGLPAILTACRDKATVRRRAVLALAPFEGPEVQAALDAALNDRDWQVRQAAEDLTS